MDINSPTEASSPECAPTPRERILAVDPHARFGRAAIPGRPVKSVVLLSPTVSVLDLFAIRNLAANIGCEMHLHTSAVAAPGTSRAAAWFIEDVDLPRVASLVPRSALQESRVTDTQAAA